MISFIVASIIKILQNGRFRQEGFPRQNIKTRRKIKHSKMGQKNKNCHIFIASQYENQEAIKTSKLTEQTTKKE